MKLIIGDDTFEYEYYEEKILLALPLKNIDNLMTVENIKGLINKIKKEHPTAEEIIFLPGDCEDMDDEEVRSKMKNFINFIKSIEENE